MQQNLQDAISNSTMATQRFIKRTIWIRKINTRISEQTQKRNEAAIDTEAEN